MARLISRVPRARRHRPTSAARRLRPAPPRQFPPQRQPAAVHLQSLGLRADLVGERGQLLVGLPHGSPRAAIGLILEQGFELAEELTRLRSSLVRSPWKWGCLSRRSWLTPVWNDLIASMASSNRARSRVGGREVAVGPCLYGEHDGQADQGHQHRGGGGGHGRSPRRIHRRVRSASGSGGPRRVRRSATVRSAARPRPSGNAGQGPSPGT